MTRIHRMNGFSQNTLPKQVVDFDFINTRNPRLKPWATKLNFNKFPCRIGGNGKEEFFILILLTESNLSIRYFERNKPLFRTEQYSQAANFFQICYCYYIEHFKSKKVSKIMTIMDFN